LTGLSDGNPPRSWRLGENDEGVAITPLLAHLIGEYEDKHGKKPSARAV